MSSLHKPSPASRILIFCTTALVMLGNCYVYDSIGPVASLLSQRLGFSDAQLGSLNAVYSLPNIALVLVGGVLVDRLGTRTLTIATTALCLVGAVLTALDGRFSTMVTGRLLFGIGAETLWVAIYVALSEWFVGPSFAFLVALNLSFARLGSYLADLSPNFAHALYSSGWQPPLMLAAAIAGTSLVFALLYSVIDRTAHTHTGRSRLTGLRLPHFRPEYWYLVGICVVFYSSIFPFRSTFAIKYFQQAHNLSLADASRLNSYVFLAAIVATPAFGLLVDRIGRHALLMTAGSLLLAASFLLFSLGVVDLRIPTALLGVSFSLVPAVLWPSVTAYTAREQWGTAYAVMAVLQNAGLTLGNLVAGFLNDRSHASAMHPQGYLPMLGFFGLLSLVGFLLAVLLTVHASKQSLSTGHP